MSVFGKPKYGATERNWFKLKDGESTYRILPPMGDLREDGRWSVFYNIHYGYKNSKGELRAFQSPLVKNRKTKMVEVPDAALDRINALKVKLEEARKNKDETTVQQLLKLVGGPKSRYNLDSNHYMNVVDLQGNVGILKIRHRAKQALDAQIKKLRDAGVEPLDPESGRFFTFSRTGSGTDTLYQVSVYKKRINAPGLGDVEQEVVHTITPELARRCLVENKDGSFTYKEAARLDRLFKAPTSTEVARIVQEGERAVDEILNSTNLEFSATSPSSEGPNDEEDTVVLPLAAALTMTQAQNSLQHQHVAPPMTATSSEVVSPLTVDTTVSPLTVSTTVSPPPTTSPSLTLSSVATEYYQTLPKNSTTTASPTKTTAQKVNEMSDDEFLKLLGL